MAILCGGPLVCKSIVDQGGFRGASQFLCTWKPHLINTQLKQGVNERAVNIGAFDGGHTTQKLRCAPASVLKGRLAVGNPRFHRGLPWQFQLTLTEFAGLLENGCE
jgi:hypothetical protein